MATPVLNSGLSQDANVIALLKKIDKDLRNKVTAYDDGSRTSESLDTILMMVSRSTKRSI